MKKKALIIPLALILIILPTVLPFFNGKFFYTQDYIFIARLQQMNTALSSGQFPVRWAPDLRYGEPIFNFYAPLPYYIGAAVSLLGFDVIWAIKILFILASVFSAAAMYILVNKLFGKKAGILSAVLYTYAPYRAVDIYVRGSLSETWAFVFLPLIFYSSLLLAEKTNLKNLTLCGLSLAGLFLTHNVTTLMFLPFLMFWWAYLIYRENKLKILPYLFLASALGLGLAAFFLLPAYFETDFIQTKYLTVGYFNFRAHFVAIGQFFSLFWGYGSSLWGPKDELSFQIGIVNLAVLGIAALLSISFRKKKGLLVLLFVLGISFLLSVFLQHNKSAFIWEAIPLMAFIQFPWRFLGISVFIAALVGGVVASYLKGKLLPVYFIIIIVAISLSLMYFRPKDYVDDSFFDKFLQVESMHRGIDLTKDYMPVWVTSVEGKRFDAPRTEEGDIEVSDLQQTSTSMQFFVNASSNSLIEIPIAYFPGWEVKVNNKIVPQVLPSKMGLIRFELPKGGYWVRAEFKDTLIRLTGNMLSLGTLLLIGIGLLYIRHKSDNFRERR